MTSFRRPAPAKRATSSSWCTEFFVSPVALDLILRQFVFVSFTMTWTLPVFGSLFNHMINISVYSACHHFYLTIDKYD